MRLLVLIFLFSINLLAMDKSEKKVLAAGETKKSKTPMGHKYSGHLFTNTKAPKKKLSKKKSKKNQGPALKGINFSDQ